MGQCILLDFKKAYYSVHGNVFCNILIEFGITTKLVKVIKVYLNETYNRVQVSRHFSDVSY